MRRVNWSAIENALHAWVVAATNLAASAVIWGYTGAPRPTAPYIAMSLDTLGQIGHDWVVYDDAPAPVLDGAELRARARGHRTARLQLQCFAVEGSEHAAVALLDRALTGLSLYATALDAAGVGLGDVSPIQLVEGRRGSLLEPRAITDVGLHLASELEGRETYIERVQITLDVPTVGEVETWIPDAPPDLES